MFRRNDDVPLLSEAGLQGFCASLNAPVVNLERLPVAPARAAIALFSEQYGGLALCIGLCSQESGQLAIFSYRGGVGDLGSPAKAMDVALSFAESMGFLFDQDVVLNGGSAGRALALETWLDLMGAREPPVVAQLLSEESELLLDELVGSDSTANVMDDLSHSHSDEAELLPEAALPEPRLDEPRRLDPVLVEVPDEDAEAEPQGVAAEAPDAPPPASMLSKFRRPASSGSTGGSKVGRIPLVRVRAENDAGDRPGWLARLLSAF